MAATRTIDYAKSKMLSCVRGIMAAGVALPFGTLDTLPVWESDAQYT